MKALGYEETDAEIFRRHSLLRNSVMAHAVWCSREDLALMKAHNSGIACCPLSNVYFASGILDLNVCQEVGVNVGLGTDISGGYSPSMMNSQRTAVVTSRGEKDRQFECVGAVSNPNFNSLGSLLQLQISQRAIRSTTRELSFWRRSDRPGRFNWTTL